VLERRHGLFFDDRRWESMNWDQAASVGSAGPRGAQLQLVRQTYAQHPISRCWVPPVGGLPFVGQALFHKLSECSLCGDHRVRFDVAGDLGCQPMGWRLEGWLHRLGRAPYISVDLRCSCGRCGCLKMAILLSQHAMSNLEWTNLLRSSMCGFGISTGQHHGSFSIDPAILQWVSNSGSGLTFVGGYRDSNP
jgi:hypothetical protein